MVFQSTHFVLLVWYAAVLSVLLPNIQYVFKELKHWQFIVNT